MSGFIKLLTGISLLIFMVLMQNSAFAEDHVIKPQVMTKADLTGEMFSRPDTLKKDYPGGSHFDVTSLLSSDDKFASGLYKSPASRFEITEPYGVDEFMFFLEGSVTLTSSDGSVLVVHAGEAVTIPKEWTGIWETEGYRKIWVIYSATGEIE